MAKITFVNAVYKKQVRLTSPFYVLFSLNFHDTNDTQQCTSEANVPGWQSQDAEQLATSMELCVSL